MMGTVRTVVLIACALLLAPQPAARAQTPDTAVVQPSARPPSGGGWSAEVKRRPSSGTGATVTAIQVGGDGTRTVVRMQVTQPIVASMFTLDEPYRAIVDVADLAFRLPAGSDKRVAGLVTAFRYGQFEAGRSRLVLDLAAPATIENAMFKAPAAGAPGVLTFDLVRVEAAAFRALRGSSGPGSAELREAERLRGARHDEARPDTPIAPKEKLRPVVVLDPGHGGIDPGTVAASGIAEKAVTLAVAMQVRSLLLQGRRYDVHLTRQADVFVALDQRVRQSRERQADLFVSIHADALGEKEMAQSVRGATLYVLSERASDDVARRLEEKENAADLLAGLATVPVSAEEQVRSILMDLVQRESANYAAAFRSLLLGHMQGKVPLAREPQRSAAFKVLRQPEVPAVLIELGYMSNSEDLARLGKAEGQRQLAASIAAAIDAYFAKRGPALRP